MSDNANVPRSSETTFWSLASARHPAHLACEMEEIPDYLKPLEYITRPFPREAVEAAIARREESIPHLLRALEWVEQHFEEVKEAEECHMLHIYALYLLAQFRETRAYPLIVRLFRHPEEDELNGDISSGGLSNMLASVCGGDLSLIKGLIEDGEVDEFVRAAAVKALGILTLAGVARPEETSGYFGTLHRGGLAPEPNYVWDSLISVCVDLGMTEHLDDIRRLYRTGIADPCYQSLEEVETEIKLPSDAAPRAYHLRSYRLIDDTVAEMKWWYCFTEKAAEEEDFDAGDVDPDPSLRDEFDLGKTYENRPPQAAIPYEREAPKVGRNDPCPCGSGKKFKKCCGGA